MSTLVTTEPTLEELAATANKEHRLCERASLNLLLHAVRAGDALVQVRDRVPQGEFEAWIRDHFVATSRTARTYMRVSLYREEIEGAESLAEAWRRVQYLPWPWHPGRGQVLPVELRDEALRLRKEGHTQSAVAEELGVHLNTVRRWERPDYFNERNRRAYRRRREAELEDRRASRDRAVRKIGGSMAESYSRIRLALDSLQAAHDEATDREVKAACGAAMAKLHGAEDEIVKALGIS